LTRSHLGLVVSAGPVVFRRYRPPAPCEAGFILSWASFAFRVSSRVHLPACVAAASAFHGVSVPHHDVSSRSPLTDGRPGPIYVPPPAFRTLSTGCSSPSLARLFHRAAVSRVLASGVVPTFQPCHLVGDRYPLAVGAAACRLPGAGERRVDLKVLLRSVVRGAERRVSPRATPIPSCVFSSLRHGLQDLGGAFAPPPLSAFTTRDCVSPASLAPSVSIDPVAVASVSRGSSCPSFSAFDLGRPTREAHRSVAGCFRVPSTDWLYSRRCATSAARPTARNRTGPQVRHRRHWRQGVWRTSDLLV